MGWTDDLILALVPPAKRDDRFSRTFVFLCVAATLGALMASAMTYAYGYGGLAERILFGALTIPFAIVLLRLFDEWHIAGHYLTANIFIQSVYLSAIPAVGCIALIGLAGGVALFPKIASRIWLGVLVGWCLMVATTSLTEIESATAAVAALVAAATFAIVQIIETSRQRSSRLEKVATQQTSGQLSVLNKLVENYFDGYLVVAGDNIVSVGPSIESFLGYAPEAFMEHPLAYYVHPDETQVLEHLQPGRPPSRHEVRVRHSDGRWVWIEAYAAPDIAHARPDRVFFVFRNFESQRKVSDQLNQAQRLESMGSMAAAVAHDFNNMLTVIMGIVDNLPAGETKKDIARVTGNAAALTGKLLTFGHGQKTSTEVHDLSHVMQEHSLLVQHMLDQKYVLFEEYIDKPVLVRIDESQFEQVVVNLVNNAREAMTEGGDMEISLQLTELSQHNKRSDATGPYAVLEVKDSGHGMSPETLARVFDPFFSTKQQRKNSGLGLSSCYGIVSQYGGFIDIDSTEGVGTSIKVYLPIAETHDHEPVLELISNAPSIMVVDDDPGVVRVIKNALNRAGHHVLGYTTPDAAMEAFTTNKIALLITDVVMSGMSGADLAAKFRAQNPELPLLFVSGFTNDELSTWEPDHITGYLAKPFRGDEVVSRAEALINHDELVAGAMG